MTSHDEHGSQGRPGVQNPQSQQQDRNSQAKQGQQPEQSQQAQQLRQGQQDQQGQQPIQNPRAAGGIQNPGANQAGSHSDQPMGQWQQQLGAARSRWGKLTNDELLQSRGEAQSLSGLVQERYALSSVVADQQVADFLASRKS